MKSLFSKKVGQHVLPLIFIHNAFVLFWGWYWYLVNTYHGKSCTDHNRALTDPISLEMVSTEVVLWLAFPFYG